MPSRWTGGTAASVVIAGTLAAAVGYTSLAGGGFDGASRQVFIALAGVALLAAGGLDGSNAARAFRSPLPRTIVALALVSAASALWTVGSATTAVHWGLLIAGYGAAFIAASVLAQRTGTVPLAAGIAVLAVLEALLGIGATAMHALPDAERIDGAWRPGGTFEYPPALAVLEVGALPILCVAMGRGAAVIAGSAAAAATLAGAALSLSDSRLAQAIALLLLVALIVRPFAGCAAITGISAGILVLIGAIVAPVVLGGRIALGASAAGEVGAATIIAIAMACGAAWIPARRHVRLPPRRWRQVLLGVGMLALLSGGWAVHRELDRAPQSRDTAASRTSGPSDFLHGRGHEWQAALETWSDHPVLGAGAGAYYVASVRHQGAAPTLYAHDLPLELAAELGVLGLLLALAMYASSAVIIARASDSAGLWLLAPTVVAFMASNLLDWTWHLAGLAAVWAAAAGGLAGASTARRSTESSASTTQDPPGRVPAGRPAMRYPTGACSGRDAHA